MMVSFSIENSLIVSLSPAKKKSFLMMTEADLGSSEKRNMAVLRFVNVCKCEYVLVHRWYITIDSAANPF